MILAIDIGGTKMAAGLVSADGTVVDSRRTATPQGAGAEALWATLETLIEPYGEADGVGVGCGGPMTWPEGAVSPLNMPGWRGFPLRARLAERFGEVRIHNDAICVAAAEHWRGAGRGSANMLGMVVSTGVGGGLILGNRLIDGGSGNAGHIGHVVVEPVGGPVCGCGGSGCLEAIARGPALVEWALAHGWTPGTRSTDGDEARQAGAAHREDRPAGAAYREDRPVTGRDLAADAEAGDEVALAALARGGWALGVAIASATALGDLDVVTIGGGVSQAGPLIFGPLEAALREHARLDFTRRVRVLPAALGQDAGLVGAAALLLAESRYWNP
ncbi:ROK family protein [Nonomuraea sp. NPDC050310]|uniref:ROK family protein n=1 Tax=unclassified Nonomuraea TaxID=2593643 RepID=UPI0033E28099